MELAWKEYGNGHLAKSTHGYYLIYPNFDFAKGTVRWSSKFEGRPTPGFFGAGRMD